MSKNTQKEVGIDKQRNYALRIAKFWLGEKQTMTKRAKTLTPQDLKQVLDYIAQHKHALRNRTMLLATYFGGMRVGEVANLRYKDVIDETGKVKDEIVLKPEQTKGKHGRTVFVNSKLKSEIEIYVRNHKPSSLNDCLFYTQKRQTKGFTPNTLAQHFHYLYKAAGCIGCTSHSGRRSYATAMSSKGVGVRVLMRALGHQNLSSTLLYVEASDDMLRKAVELV